jgi:ABC-type oligopeptide transport system substrate-binding subunit
MKKLALLFAFLTLSSSVLLTACGGGAGDETTPETEVSPAEEAPSPAE